MDTPIDTPTGTPTGTPTDGDAPTGTPTVGDAAEPNVDPRMRDRWVAARREEGRKRLRIFVIVVCILSVIGLGYVVANSSLLGVDHVRVRGVTTVPAATVTGAAAIEPGSPLLFLDTDAIERRVEAIPQIGNATVDTELPNTVVITVTERTPLGWVQAVPGGPIAVIDGTGRVLRTDTEPPALTHIVGAGAPVAPGRSLAPDRMRALAELPVALQLRAESLEFAAGAATITLRGAPPEAKQVRLGSLAGMAEKGRVAAAILEDLRGRGQQVEFVDVSVPSAPVTR